MAFMNAGFGARFAPDFRAAFFAAFFGAAFFAVFLAVVFFAAFLAVFFAGALRAAFFAVFLAGAFFAADLRFADFLAGAFRAAFFAAGFRAAAFLPDFFLLAIDGLRQGDIWYGTTLTSSVRNQNESVTLHTQQENLRRCAVRAYGDVAGCTNHGILRVENRPRMHA
jgi:hypothetical protein